jgi:hypothetical protein
MVLGHKCAFKFFSVGLMKLGVLTLGAYKLIIVISFWCSAPLISMKWPLSHLTNVSLKSTLSNISIAIPACFGGERGISLVNLLPAFHPKPVFILSIGLISSNKRLLDLPFKYSLFNGDFWWRCWVHWHSGLILIVMCWILSLSGFCCLRIWLCVVESMLPSDYLSFLPSTAV